VFYHGFFESRSVVVKHEVIRFFVVAEFVQTVSIREFAERAKLFKIELILELVGGSHECHARNYNIHSWGGRKHSQLG